MAHPYAQERAVRTAFVESAQDRLSEILQQETACRSIGFTASESLRVMNREIFVPDVSDAGIVSLPDERLASDAIPVAALKNREILTCDRTFATFSLLQHFRSPSALTPHFPDLSSRVVSQYNADEFDARIFGQLGTVKRMVYCIPGYPSPEERTYFNMRPFALINFDQEIDKAACVLANALTRAEQVVNHAVVTVPDDHAFEDINEAWVLEGNLIQQKLLSAIE